MCIYYIFQKSQVLISSLFRSGMQEVHEHDRNQHDRKNPPACVVPSLPSNAASLPTDLTNPNWAQRLCACSAFCSSAETLCSLLGLFYYLEEAAFSALLAFNSPPHRATVRRPH